MEIILFDQRCAGWSWGDEINRRFLKLQLDYLNEILTFQGYLYLTKIYETIGAPWDPDWDNRCFRSANGKLYMIIERDLEYGTYLLKIYQ